MVRKKIDNRIRILMENNVKLNQRSMFVVVGEKARDQVVILHHILAKATIKARPSVLWCYKKELGFRGHRKKKMKQFQKKRVGNAHIDEDDPFMMFIASTQIRYCYYSETQKILGNTFGMCILQDFEALTPNVLARTIETVDGGGLVVFLLHSVSSLRQLFTLTMDVHSRYRTESHSDVIGRFNERFILSLISCKSCMIINDKLDLLPITREILAIEELPSDIDTKSTTLQELNDLKETMRDTQTIGSLIDMCKTIDQAKAVLKFIDAIVEKSLKSTISLTAARGRGKSAALGLAIAGAIAFGYSNIFVTSPSPENLKTLFDFVFKGFDALKFEEHVDYDLMQSTNPDFNKAIVRINVFRDHRQVIQYIHPSDANKLGQAELLVIDEAAAIPLPLVKKLFGHYLIFLSSTINGYEGTGRSLSLKLLTQLRQQAAVTAATSVSASEKTSVTSGRTLSELTLEESIRYAPGDQLESWLNGMLCLNVTDIPRIMSGCPKPDSCDLYYVSRDTLFSYHRASESFLQRLMSIYVSAHYKNSPNDLQMLSDAPAHHLFVLLGPVDTTKNVLPEILVVIQVCMEGRISRRSVEAHLTRGKRASGDLIPWTISQQFGEPDFPSLSGARIIRIATHPDFQNMGYGSKALEILENYYSGNFPSLSDEVVMDEIEPYTDKVDDLSEEIKPRSNLPPLLLKLNERPHEQLDYIGVSFGLTAPLLRFWKRAGYVPLYIRQTPNDLTGEHSTIVIKSLLEEANWLREFNLDFQNRFINLLGYEFKTFAPSTCLNILHLKVLKFQNKDLGTDSLRLLMSPYDMKRLSQYAKRMIDYHLIMDLIPNLARLYFSHKLQIQLSAIQATILLGVGLQHKTVDELASEIDIAPTQILGLFAKIVFKISEHFQSLFENEIMTRLAVPEYANVEENLADLDEELKEAENKIKARQAEDAQFLLEQNFSQYAIKADDEQWEEVLQAEPCNKKKSINIGRKLEVEKVDVDALIKGLESGKQKFKKFDKLKTKGIKKFKHRFK